MRDHKKTTIHNMQKFVWKAQFFKSADVKCWFMAVVFHNILSVMTAFKYIYQMLPRPYVGIYSGEKGQQNFQEPWILALSHSVENFVVVSISGMTTVQYWQNLGSFGINQKRRFLGNAELVIHVLRHWQLLEVIYSQ